MQLSPPAPHALTTLPPEEKDRVLSQLERLLQSSHFRNSKRYPTLLRHIVEEALEGRGGLLKERTLGAEVFGRPADYDTASDPIVRVTVAEIRKRIAQYYHEDAHGSELRIELNPGSYIPEFLSPREQESSDGVATPPHSVVPHPAPADLSPVQDMAIRRSTSRLWTIVALAFGLITVAAAVSWFALKPTPMERLWSPFFAASGPITYCMPMSARRKGLGSANTTDEAIAHALDLQEPVLPASYTLFDHQIIGENVVLSDVLSLVKLESVVEGQHRPVHVRLNVGTDLNELREGPAIFIGGLSNQWTLRLIDPLRYRFAGSDADSYYIRDAKDPGNRRWSVSLREKMTTVNRDYAIIARVHGEPLGQIAFVVAGIGMSGTAAAGEFLSNPDQVKELERRIGYANRNRDFEAVLTTSVENGIAGPAEIVALDVR